MTTMNEVVPLRILELTLGFFRHSLTLDERRELDDWLALSEENIRLFGKLQDLLAGTTASG